MLMKEIHGVGLHELIRAGQEKDFVSMAEGLLRKMFNCGFDWPDYKPEHFIVMSDGRMALIDLERMTLGKAPLDDGKIAEGIASFHRKVERIK